jgi:hypothetical protein
MGVTNAGPIERPMPYPRFRCPALSARRTLKIKIEIAFLNASGGILAGQDDFFAARRREAG